MEKEVIRVLHFVPNLNNGGTETFIMNIYRNIDRTKIQFDFVVHTSQKGVFEEEITQLGGKIYRLPIKDDKNFFKYSKKLKELFKNNKYKVIHVAIPSIGFIPLKVAKKMGIKVRIAHSHSASHDNNLRGYIKNITSKFMKYYSNVNFACSEKAGKYLFGNKPFKIIHNAVNVSKYLYNKEDRKQIRNEFNINDNQYLLGHIGRLSIEKNQKFLINIINKMKENEEFILMLVGSGQDEKDLKEMVSKLNLNDRVIFTGNRKDAHVFYKAFDCFLLPSLYEGLPTVAVEAQISGLNCILSDTITTEVALSNKVVFLKLEEKLWVNEILKKKNTKNRNINENDFNDYNILQEAKRLQDIYIKECDKNYEKN